MARGTFKRKNKKREKNALKHLKTFFSVECDKVCRKKNEEKSFSIEKKEVVKVMFKRFLIFKVIVW